MVPVMRKPLVEGDFPRLSAAHRNNAVFPAINSPANKGKHKQTAVQEIVGVRDAVAIIEAALRQYREKFGA